ncbi:hypothetical protein FJZ41_02780 [Candidatus Shapirobacteria bacterium]|nr:hypothetical protein [Candidatus Shapirobacteria bacterium]
MNQLQSAILKTLAYADVFDSPLTLKELHLFLIGQKAELKDLKKAISELKQVEKSGLYLFIKGQRQLVYQRQKRAKVSLMKLKIARKVAWVLKTIPTVKMVALTGALAMNNTQKKDDIDFLVVTSKNRLWLTRPWIVFLIELLARRRHPGDKEFEDKICLNMFLAEDCLKIPPQEQSLYTAHEICQLKPLWQKDNLYQKLLKANSWSQKFLPNWKP